MSDASGMMALLEKAQADLRAADADVEVALADVEKANAAHAAAKVRQAAMRATVEWFTGQVHDLSAEPVVPQTAAAEPGSRGAATRMVFGKPMSATPLTRLCIETLEKLGRSANTKQVRESLAREGHEFNQGQVRSTLKYLAGKKNAPIEMTKPGVWRLRRPRTQEPFTPEPVTAVPALNGTGRVA